MNSFTNQSMSDKKRKGEDIRTNKGHAAPPPPLSIEEQYAAYNKALTAYYKANKTKHVDGLYEKLIKAGIFDPEVQKVKDVPWQLVKLLCKREFDSEQAAAATATSSTDI